MVVVFTPFHTVWVCFKYNGGKLDLVYSFNILNKIDLTMIHDDNLSTGSIFEFFYWNKTKNEYQSYESINKMTDLKELFFILTLVKQLELRSL